MLFQKILGDLKKKVDTQLAYKALVVDSFKEVFGITLSPDAIISFKDGILHMNISPSIKMALNLKKELLLHTLQEKGLKVTSIR